MSPCEMQLLRSRAKTQQSAEFCALAICARSEDCVPANGSRLGKPLTGSHFSLGSFSGNRKLASPSDRMACLVDSLAAIFASKTLLHVCPCGRHTTRTAVCPSKHQTRERQRDVARLPSIQKP